MARFGISIWFLLPVATSGLLAADEPRDIAAFKAYLEKNHPGKKWQTGPERIDGPEIQAAYGKHRFYAVASTPPLPPGAPLPELLKAYAERMAEYRKSALSLTIAIDDKGAITPLLKPADYGTGLMAVASADDAKKAAAAILALHQGDGVGLGAVPAAKIEVKKTDAGWLCSGTKANVYAGTVTFNATGQCVVITKKSISPLPPSAPPPSAPPPSAPPSAPPQPESIFEDQVGDLQKTEVFYQPFESAKTKVKLSREMANLIIAIIAEPPGAGLKSLQGTWQIQAKVVGGAEFPRELLDKVMVFVAEDKMNDSADSLLHFGLVAEGRVFAQTCHGMLPALRA